MEDYKDAKERHNKRVQRILEESGGNLPIMVAQMDGLFDALAMTAPGCMFSAGEIKELFDLLFEAGFKTNLREGGGNA